MRRKSEGITILELVIVLAIIGILGGIAVVSGSTIARRQAAHGAIATFQQSVWQGATAAASRGLTVELIRSGGQLQLVNTANDTVLRRFDLPNGVDIPVENPILRFLPPGKVDRDTLPEEFVIDTGEGRYTLQISIIGEVRSEQIGDG